MRRAFIAVFMLFSLSLFAVAEPLDSGLYADSPVVAVAGLANMDDFPDMDTPMVGRSYIVTGETTQLMTTDTDHHYFGYVKALITMPADKFLPFEVAWRRSINL